MMSNISVISFERSAIKHYKKFVSDVKDMSSEAYVKWVESEAESLYQADSATTYEEHVLAVFADHASWLSPNEFMKFRSLDDRPDILTANYYELLFVKIYDNLGLLAQLGKL